MDGNQPLPAVADQRAGDLVGHIIRHAFMHQDHAIHQRHRHIAGHERGIGRTRQNALRIGVFLLQMVAHILWEGDHMPTAPTLGNFRENCRRACKCGVEVVHLAIIIGRRDIGVGPVQIAPTFGPDLVWAGAEEFQDALQRHFIRAAALRGRDFQAALRQDGAHILRPRALVAQEMVFRRRIAGAKATQLVVLGVIGLDPLHGGGSKGINPPADLGLVVVDARGIGQPPARHDADLQIRVFFPDQGRKPCRHGVPATAHGPRHPFQRGLRRSGANEGGGKPSAEQQTA